MPPTYSNTKPCALCGSVARDRRAINTSGTIFPFPEEHVLSRFCDARLHLDCLGRWEQRSVFSRAYYDIVRHEALSKGLLLAEGDGWLFKYGATSPERKPVVAVLQLADWPFRIFCTWRKWPEGALQQVAKSFTDEARGAAEMAMMQLLQLASDMSSLEKLRLQAESRYAQHLQGTQPQTPNRWNAPPWRRRVIPLPPLTDAELLLVEQLDAGLRSRGWAHEVTVDRLLRSWLGFTGDEAGSVSTAGDFAHRLCCRDALEEVLEACPAPLVDTLTAVILPADERYRAATQNDGGRSLSRFVPRPGSGWWWHRRPVTGRLAASLDARACQARPELASGGHTEASSRRLGPEGNGRSRAPKELTHDEQVIRECLRAAVDGPFFPGWEFHTLIGLMREEVAAVLAAWPSADAPDKEKQAVNGTLLNLLWYPHKKDAAWNAYLSVSYKEVTAVFERWRAAHYLKQ